MNHGPAWIILEESQRRGTRELVSIQSSRRSAWEIAKFVEQACVDRSASIGERLQYKKPGHPATYQPLIDGHVMHCGHDPVIIGIRAQQTALRGNTLEFRYRIIARRGADPADIAYEERVQTLVLES